MFFSKDICQLYSLLDFNSFVFVKWLNILKEGKENLDTFFYITELTLISVFN